jgi:MFS family permease
VGFSPITTTIVFGVYALAVLASLLTLGRLSDYAGRRPVLFTVSYLGMGVPAVAAGFLAVHGAGLTGAATDYGAALIVLAALALAALVRTRRGGSAAGPIIQTGQSSEVIGDEH